MTTSANEVSCESLAVDVIVTDDTLTVTLEDGRSLSIPLAWFPRLIHGSHEERQSWQLIGKGRGIHWELLDEDISVAGLMAGQRSSESQHSFENWLNGKRVKNR